MNFCSIILQFCRCGELFNAKGNPDGFLDTVGLTTAHNIVKQYCKIPSFLAPYHFRDIEAMLQQYLDAGKLGMSSGEGFYTYK